jgi:hypothetical protein
MAHHMTVLYHGTNANFDVFVVPEKGKNGDMFGPAVYITDNTEYARLFGRNVVSVEVASDLNIIDERNTPRHYGHYMKHWALAHGYDAVRRILGPGKSELAVFDPCKVNIVK